MVAMANILLDDLRLPNGFPKTDVSSIKMQMFGMISVMAIENSYKATEAGFSR